MNFGSPQKMCCFYLAPDTPTPPLSGSHFCTAIVGIASLLPPTPLRHWVCFLPRESVSSITAAGVCPSVFPPTFPFFAQVYVYFQSSIPIFDFFPSQGGKRNCASTFFSECPARNWNQDRDVNSSPSDLSLLLPVLLVPDAHR